MIKNPKFDDVELDKERKVIFEEIKMCHDSPTRYVFDEIQKNLYTGTRGINLAGTEQTMNSVNRKKIIKKFREIYTPNNLILCVVGDADLKKLVSFCENNFGKEFGKIPEQKFELKNETKIEERTGIDQANLIFAYHVPTANDKKHYSAIVLSTLMSEGMSSRLFSEIREKRNLAYVIKGEADVNKRFAYNFVYVGTMKENVEQVKKLILEEFEKVSLDLEEEELNTIKEQLIGQYKISMEDSQTQMVNLIAFEMQGNAADFYNFEKNILNVGLKDVKELAKKASKNYSFFALVPK